MACCKNHKIFEADWCRGYPIVFNDGEGNEYCVFHAPEGEKRIPREEFKEKVFAEIYRAKEGKRACDLSGTVFEWDISFREFDKDNPLPEISFSWVNFSGETNFSEAEFSGRADLSWAEFSGRASFYGANFKEADFSWAKFSREADFSWAKFSGEAYFIRAKFTGKTVFSNARFSKWADFLFANFKDALFHSASFEGRAIFKNVAIEERLCFQNMELKKPSFLGTDLRKCDFIACQWHEEDGRRILYDETELMEEEEKRLAKAKAGWLKRLWVRNFSTMDVAGMKQVEDLYRTMKQKARDKHDEFAYSHWHYSEKEMQRKSTGPGRLFHFTVLNLYWLLNGYGEEPRRAGLLLVALFFGIVALFGIAGLRAHYGSADSFRDFFLATLQYATFERQPDFTPVNDAGRYLKVATRILIPIQVAFVVIALRNRFRR